MVLIDDDCPVCRGWEVNTGKLECELQQEKKRRVYYQDIVYDVCSKLDAARAGHLSKGTGLVCGTVVEPSNEVQNALYYQLSELQTTRKELERLRATMSHRRCWKCGHIGYYTDAVLPYCKCAKCGSADTRLV